MDSHRYQQWFEFVVLVLDLKGLNQLSYGVFQVFDHFFNLCETLRRVTVPLSVKLFLKEALGSCDLLVSADQLLVR